MKEQVAEVWRKYKGGTLSLSDVYEKIKEMISFTNPDSGSDIVINTEDLNNPRLEVIMEEDNVILNESLTDEECDLLEDLGVPQV